MKTQVVVKRPIMRYPGGKWVIAKKIIAHFPPHRVYVEPYAGAASVLLQKPRVHTEIINDLDGEVINLFQVMRNPLKAEELKTLVELTPFSRSEYFYAFESSEDGITDVERARRTVIKAFMGHGSDSVHHRNGYRGKGFRSGKPPAGDWRNYPDHIVTFVERLRGVNIENRPAVGLIKHVDTKGTLFYLDPPYVPGTRHPTLYNHEMEEYEHDDLLKAITNLEGMVVLSGYRNELYEDTLLGWRSVDIPAYADGGRGRVETLWLSPNIPSIPQLFNDYSEVQA